ncbi:MAG: glutamate 5-kinase [Pseudobdellovibrionaceae bacterium]|nr:glutamate 5-kinase [Pseudobdellovibrionaceae bacterium]
MTNTHLKSAQDILSNAQRIVVKIGTETITKNGQVDTEFLNALAEDVADLKAQGKEVFIVTSGAIALGRGPLNINLQTPTSELPMDVKQKASGVGQIILINSFLQAFMRQGLLAQQILLAKDDIDNPERLKNLRQASYICEYNGSQVHNIVPIYNEDDALVTKEISFGDNDGLGADLSVALEADAYIMLSDIDGLHVKNPKLCAQGEENPLIPHVVDLSKAFSHANDNTNGLSKGGMKSKGKAAKTTTENGIPAIITLGKNNPHALMKLITGQQNCTIVHPQQRHEESTAVDMPAAAYPMHSMT